MKRILLLIAMAGIIFTGTGNAEASLLNDWGVNPSTNDWDPISGIYYTVEDYTGSDGYVGPGWGGQLFDAEAMYFKYDSANLYVALVTGFPNTGAGVNHGGTTYSAGDIAIDFGINGSYDYAIEIGNHSSSYAYPGSWWGFSGDIGGVYDVTKWRYSDWPGYEDVPINMHYDPSNLPTLAGNASSFSYLNTYPNSDPLYDHWVIETSIPKSVFGSDWDGHMRLSWTETCGNDITTAASPEPISMLLFGSGALGVLFRKRRKS